MMRAKMFLVLLSALLAVSVPVGAAVISINIETVYVQGTGGDPNENPMYGDVTDSFTTGTNTEWNVYWAADDNGLSNTQTTGPLGTMDGSGTTNDVKFTIGSSAGQLGKVRAKNDSVYCYDSTTSSNIDEYEFAYTGLIPGESYDLKFRCNRNYSKITIDGVTVNSAWSTHMLNFNGAVADENGVITGYIRENNSSADYLYWMQIRGNFDAMYASPSGGELVSSAVDTPLTWTNLVNPDPNISDVYVEVYCEQNADPNVLAASGLNIDTATVDTTALGDFYWRVDTYFDYVDENNKGAVTRGIVYYFVSVADVPVTSVDPGEDMITWSGQSVALSATVVDDGKSSLTYSWSADPNSGVILTEVPDDGDDLTSDSANPTVTITKATNNPSAVTLTVAVNDESIPLTVRQDSVTIDVYDDACKAAAATGVLLTADINEDCNTNLADLAILAETWLVDTRISGAVTK